MRVRLAMVLTLGLTVAVVLTQDALVKGKPAKQGEKQLEQKGDYAKPPDEESKEDPKKIMERIARSMIRVEANLKKFDVSVATRKLQRDIVNDLDKFLEQAKSKGSTKKEPDKGQAIQLRIIGRLALTALLDEAQNKIQEKLLQICDQQVKAIQKVASAAKELQATGTLGVKGKEDLASAERLQKDVKDKAGATETRGLRGEVDHLQQTVHENNLAKSEVAQRLQTIKTELDRLADGPVKLIEDSLHKTRINPHKKNDLKTAQANQQEVQGTIEELLVALENWSGLNKFKAELRPILQEQEAIQKDCERIHREQPDGNKLSTKANVDLRQLAALQGFLADRTQKLIEKMERVSVELVVKDINTAKLLEKAALIAQESLLPGLMVDTAKDQLLNKKGDPRLFRAIENQAEACKILESMIEALEEQRDALRVALIKNQKQEQHNLDKLAEHLQKLQKRIQQAHQLADAKERQALLGKLAAEERKLQQDLKNKARALARLQAPRAKNQLEQGAKAAKVMDGRETKAGQRQKPDMAAPPFTKEELAEEIRLEQLTQKHQREANKRLERLLEALKESLDMAKNEGQESGDGGGGAKSRPVDGIPPMVQLKVLREEQQALARRTLECAERHPDPRKLTPAQRQELLEIHNDQETLGNLFLGMLKTLKNEGANP